MCVVGTLFAQCCTKGMAKMAKTGLIWVINKSSHKKDIDNLMGHLLLSISFGVILPPSGQKSLKLHFKLQPLRASQQSQENCSCTGQLLGVTKKCLHCHLCSPCTYYAFFYDCKLTERQSEWMLKNWIFFQFQLHTHCHALLHALLKLRTHVTQNQSLICLSPPRLPCWWCWGQWSRQSQFQPQPPDTTGRGRHRGTAWSRWVLGKGWSAPAGLWLCWNLDQEIVVTSFGWEGFQYLMKHSHLRLKFTLDGSNVNLIFSGVHNVVASWMKGIFLTSELLQFS